VTFFQKQVTYISNKSYTVLCGKVQNTVRINKEMT